MAASIEDFLDEFDLLLGSTFVLELLDMVKSELFFGHPDLLSLLDKTSDLFLDLLGVGGTEQDILDKLIVRKVFSHNLLEHFEVFILSEKPVSFVNDNTLQVREVGCHFSSFQTIIKFAQSCNQNVSV